jgi:membrane-associated phospholipid phosphatase
MVPVKSLYSIASIALALSLVATAQAQTTASTPSLFTWRDALLGGSFVIGTLAIRPLDKRVATSLQRPERQRSWIFQRSSTVVRTIAQPGSFVIGASMYGAGRLTKSDRLAAVGLHGTEGLLIGALSADVLKDLFGRERPFVDTIAPDPNDWQIFRGFKRGGNYQSFPSGHTVAAFAAASAVSAETSHWYPAATYFVIGPILYGGATAVGLSRMYNNRHWASDVILGAAIGTFAGMKVVRYNHTHPNGRVDRALLDVSWTPGTGNFGFSVLPDLRRRR